MKSEIYWPLAFFRAYLVPVLKILPKINPTHPYVYKSGTLVAKSQTQLLSVTAVSQNSLKIQQKILQLSFNTVTYSEQKMSVKYNLIPIPNAHTLPAEMFGGSACLMK